MDDEQNNQAPVSEVPMVEQEKYLRLAADFENFRKQIGLAQQDLAKWAGQAVVTDVLEPFDLLEVALSHAPPEAKSDPAWFGGLEQVSRQFLEKMKKYGVTRIETAGQAFDPVTMEAVDQVPGGESQKVKEEIRAGYKMYERVIRPARVIVYT